MQGDKCLCAYKVKKGCLRSYVMDKTGKEHILQFAPEGWLVSDINSFVNNQPAAIFIDTIEDAELWVLDRSFFSAMENQSNKELIQFVNTLTNNVIAANKRLILLLSSTAEERYIDFMETYPTLLQRLPLKLIASYIGITPEYLSEIRKKRAGK